MDLPKPRRLQPRHMGRSPLQRHFLRLKSLSGKIPYGSSEAKQPTDTHDKLGQYAELESMRLLQRGASAFR